MKELKRLMDEAINYAKAYQRKYKINDNDLLEKIYIGHLTHLMNKE